ncbi:MULTISPECIES: hypothetical protein [Brevibacterium]|uniref:Uncharacterized protein n=1 Tax=Brevibacterium antiquum CNRZ 918 TaxID=1255637 RepID=A0A2H1KD27_9MICO|nr:MULTISPECIES: hypothetical protein [Brevibacterium]SMX97707.1 hypothetical protein BANT918_02351 [Brevibacterium antiquum CNRZ 918]HCG55361.1 hypothetical protein [Brevibacterium sp.]
MTDYTKFYEGDLRAARNVLNERIAELIANGPETAHDEMKLQKFIERRDAIVKLMPSRVNGSKRVKWGTPLLDAAKRKAEGES